MTHLIESQEFHERLSEVISWCTRRPVASDPAYSLRSPALRPNVVTAQAYAQALPDVAQFDRGERKPERSIPEWRRWGWSWSNQADGLPYELPWTTLVDELRVKRLKQLRAERIDPSRFADSLGNGRLLLYSPRENLYDGAACVYSEGLFDCDNIPAWDTWVCYTTVIQRDIPEWRLSPDETIEVLVSWIPPQLMDIARQGVAANPEQCIIWLPDVMTSSLRQIL
jgi:hypothetical protein